MLDEQQVNKLIRWVQAGVNATVLTAPRITLFNGQAGSIMVGQEQAIVAGWGEKEADGNRKPVNDKVMTNGVSLNVQATASADRKHITMTCQARAVELQKINEVPWDKAGPGEKLTVHKPDLTVREVGAIWSVPDGTTLLTVLKVKGEAADKAPRVLLLLKPELIMQREIVDAPKVK
jgi:type II secretory pathway component GspD/PulD (secretin)